jgi:hypothetical protein
MDELEKRELLSSLALGQISHDSFVRRVLDTAPVAGDVVEAMLAKAYSSHDGLDVQFSLALLQGVNIRHLHVSWQILCKLMRADWHYSHEDLAMLLAEMRESESVDCLLEASRFRLPYLEYDETFQLARKCIKALSKIGTAAALEGIRELSHDSNAVIASYADKELQRISRE